MTTAPIFSLLRYYFKNPLPCMGIRTYSPQQIENFEAPELVFREIRSVAYVKSSNLAGAL